MHRLLTTKLGMEIQATPHSETTAIGLNDRLWTVRVKATACPAGIRNTAVIVIDNAELLLHHSEVYVNWPCTACHSPEHPTKYCRIPEEDIAKCKQIHSIWLEGRLPLQMGKGSRNYGKSLHPKTLDQLQKMLQQDREGEETKEARGRERAKSSKSKPNSPIRQTTRG